MLALQLFWCAVGGIGIHNISAVMADAPVRVGSAASTPPKWPTGAFATGLAHHKRSKHRIDGRQPFAPSQYRHPSTRLPMMLPEHRELTLAAITSITFLPLVDYLIDLGTFMLGLSFMGFAASTFLSDKLEEQPGEPSPALAAAGSGGGGSAADPKDILTPETYADSMSAEEQVEIQVSQSASEAFESTDFANEPQLSPELEDREAAVEVALLAEAAHELVALAEKENKQSKAAMVERQKELEWIERTAGSANKATRTEAFQRSLLAAQLANRNSAKELLTPQTYADSRSAKQQVDLKVSQMASEAFETTDFSLEPHLSPELEDREAAVEAALLANAAHELVELAERENRQSKAAMLERQKQLEWIETDADSSIEQTNAGKREAFQRSLLSARIANDARKIELAVEEQVKEEWVESEALAATMGGRECVNFGVAEAAATSAAAHALQEVEAAAKAEGQGTVAGESDPPANPVAAASMVADAAERMILGEDLAFAQVASEEDEWRKDYAQDIKSAAQTASVQQTNQTPSQGFSDEVATVTETHATNTSRSVVKRVQKGGFLRRVRERKRLLIAALAVVVCRRLFLAYFGNASRLL